jgi:endonuclease III
MESKKQKASRLIKIIIILKKEYPDAHCRLTHRSPFELLVKTILSAQCTDERVNQIGDVLFSIYAVPEDFIKIPLNQLETIIRPVGFFHTKAHHIKQTAEILSENYNGTVPEGMEDLLKLPGVGRKTANVIRGTVFSIPGVIVDTHVIRLSKRLNLSSYSDPKQIEKDLMKIIPEKEWSFTSHALGELGRKICKARKPDCPVCCITGLCPYFKNSKK